MKKKTPPVFKEYTQGQIVLLPMDLETQIPPKHLVRVVSAVIEKMDLTALHAQYKVVSSCNPCRYFYSVTFTTSVTNTLSAISTKRISLAAMPTGTVTLQDKGTNIAGCVNTELNSLGQAVCNASLPGGEHTITAQYSGDANFNAGMKTFLQKMDYLIAIPWVYKSFQVP
jgi:hypothetical protein